MAQHNHSTPVAGKFTSGSKMKSLIFGSIFVGIIFLLVGFQMDKSAEHSSVWQGYLIAFFYFVSLGLGGLFFTAIQHVTKAGWSVPVRRVAEAFTAFLPLGVLLAVVYVVFGTHHMYEWMHKDVVAADANLIKKASYLNEKFYLVRTFAFFGLWLLFAKLIVGNSLKQDQSGDHALTLKNVPLSIGFLVVFALSYSLFGVDQLMSLDPHWFSTIFGVYCFSGLFQSTLAMMIIFTVWFMRKGLTNQFVNENHLHDLAKLMFAFTVFYAYIAFSQFMLIWYANMPEETIFFARRAHGGWMAVSMSLLVFKFAIPFLTLLPRAWKRDPNHIVMVAVLILIMQYVDVFWLVSPNFSENFSFPLVGIGIFFGFLGLFLMTVTKFFEKNAVVPLKDPRMHEALNHHI